MKRYGFYRGVNLGGWMSQCDYSLDRLNSFITEKDIATIASWGADHVRLPLDYNVLENEDGTYKPENFARIAKAYDWCRANGLNMVLDLHKTAGYSFDVGEKEAGFFDSETYQERFYRLWEEIARNFGRYSDHIAFELLNEVTDPSVIKSWNSIVKTCIRRIRAIAPDTLILVGSYYNNAPSAVKDLDAPADDKVVYNFHCYDPVTFTHQHAYWVYHMDVNHDQSFEEANLPADYFDQLFAPAIEAAKKYGAMLYCGEYGVIDRATPEDTVKWYRQIHETFEKYGIARSAWSYKQMDFGLSDTRLDGVRNELVKLL